MRKLVAFILSCFFLLAGCSNRDWEVTVKTTPFYKEGVAAPFAVQIKTNGKPVKQLTVHATFEMVNMDHGKIEVDLNEKGNGVYEGNVQLPMEGDWEALLLIQHGKEKVEKMLKMHVKKEEAVAKVANQKITMKEVRFYQLLNKIKIAIQQENDKAKYKGAKLKERLAYWERQEQYTRHLNQAVAHLVELHAMAMLAKEKGHTVTKSELNEALATLQQQYARYKMVEKMIQTYGEKTFWEDYQQYSELALLTNDVFNDLAGEVKKANPNVGENEIRYLAQKQYEELLISQVNSLHIELYIPNRLS